MLLTDFLLREIAADEALAAEAVPDPAGNLPAPVGTRGPDGYLRSAGGPSALLAECEARRHIVLAHLPGDPARQALPSGCARCRAEGAATAAWDPRGSCETLRLLAVAYADRPGYNPWWEPAWLRGALAV